AVSHCVGVSQWGVDDAHSWILGTFPGWGDATMYDNNDQHKPTYSAVVTALGGSSSGGGGGAGSVHAVGAGKCLDVPNSSTTAGSPDCAWTCRATPPPMAPWSSCGPAAAAPTSNGRSAEYGSRWGRSRRSGPTGITISEARVSMAVTIGPGCPKYRTAVIRPAF